MADFTHSAGVSVVELDNASGTPVDVSQYMPGLSLETSLETSDGTTLADVARKFVFGLEDGGETSQDIYLDDAGVVWTQLAALWNARYVGTVAVYPMGKTNGKPKISREVGITKLGTPVQVGELNKVSVTFKANGATTLGTHS